MNIEWNRVTTLSKFLALLLFVALPLVGFYLGTKYQKAISEIEPVKFGEVANQATTSQEQSGISGAQTQSDQPKKKTTVTGGLTYTQAVNIYSDRRIQFGVNCETTPSSIVLKNRTDVMFDNRWNGARSFALNGKRYNLDPYGFTIVRVEGPTLPYNVRIDCGSGVNNGLIILE